MLDCRFHINETAMIIINTLVKAVTKWLRISPIISSSKTSQMTVIISEVLINCKEGLNVKNRRSVLRKLHRNLRLKINKWLP